MQHQPSSFVQLRMGKQSRTRAKVSSNEDANSTKLPPVTTIQSTCNGVPGQREQRDAGVKEGLVHILLGYDHILFIIGLAIAAHNLRRLALIVTAFTAAHSITLALASLQIVTIPSEFAEALIALSVAYVGLENLVSKPKRRALLAFLFGLVHGVGFSSVLAERLTVLGADGHTVQLLFGFNVGVELGQLAIVCAVYPLVAILRRRQRERLLVAPVSLALLVFGLLWFFQRVL